MGLSKKEGIAVGFLPKGERNLITDVAGVLVGHCTITEGSVQTGVTAVKPHPGNVFLDKPKAACLVFNGFGKSVGLMEIEEMGFLETPVLLTNTLSVGAASEALVKYMLLENEDIGKTTGTVNPVVCECNDGYLNDIRRLYVKEKHVFQALAGCSDIFEEGAVGAGRGMRCHGLKGGIGSASRLLSIDGGSYTLGALVLTNHGAYRDLTVNGRKLSEEIPEDRLGSEGEKGYSDIQDTAVGTVRASLKEYMHRNEERGSCIVILATDVPLSERQLKRLCGRVPVGLARLGNHIGNGSGELAVAFTTANRIPHYPHKAFSHMAELNDNHIDQLFRAVAESVEEAVLSSLFHAETVFGRDGHRAIGLKEIFR